MEPLALHPDNPHYFRFRGEATVLVTSGEHYGSVLNADFDYATYLDVIAAAGFNLTRLFTGTYYEKADSIPWIGEQNTLAPRPGRHLCPWARSRRPGYAGGGNLFDLDRWDEAYFVRLRDFCTRASERGIVVEVVLFCPMYQGLFGEALWELSPLYAGSNVQGVGTVTAERFTTLADPALVARQEQMVRKFSAELAAFDNVYYEICNEPYWSRAEPEDVRAWQWRMTEVLAEAESALPAPHLIAHNIANGSAVVTDPHPAVGLLNFHYAYPPHAVAANYGLSLALGDDETADGTVAGERRREGWAFLLAGGSDFSNLDWSFARDDPLGEGRVAQAEGRIYDGREVRRHLAVLLRFMRSLDLLPLHPDPNLVVALPEGTRAYALAESGRQYAIYLEGTSVGSLPLRVEPGTYRVGWWDPTTGPVRTETVSAAAGRMLLTPPPYTQDLAVLLRAT